MYSLAAAAYRWVVALSICWFLYKLFQSYHLKFVGQIVVLMSLYGLFVMPLYQVGKFFYVPGRIDQVKKPYFYTTLGMLSAAVLAFCFLPLPHSIDLHPGGASPRRQAGLRRRGGQSRPARREGGPASRRRPDLGPTAELRPRSGGGQAARQRQGVLRRNWPISGSRVSATGTLWRKIPAVQEAPAMAEKQLQDKQRDQERLRLVAPSRGLRSE